MTHNGAISIPVEEVLGDSEIKIELPAYRVFWIGNDLGLSLSEGRMVRMLWERRGHDISYQELYSVLRPEGFAMGTGVDGFKTNVRAFAKRIRSKFHLIDPEFDQIENRNGFGYRWRPQVPGLPS